MIGRAGGIVVSMARPAKRIVRRVGRLVRSGVRLVSAPRLTGSQIVFDLQTLGVRAGGILLVHSSLSSMGHVVGGAETVIRSLIEVIGPEGTLVLPTHTWSQMERGCRVFDVRHTPSCVGRVPEAFRRSFGPIRSLHPTHSVAALGPLADWLIAGHERCGTPCGAGSPYAKILDSDGQVLLLGVGLEAHTTFHAIEATAGVAYLMREAPESFTIVDQSGRAQTILVRRHRGRVARRFRAVEPLLTAGAVARSGSIGRARSLLIAGGAFQVFLVDRLRENPDFLLAEPMRRPDRGPTG